MAFDFNYRDGINESPTEPGGWKGVIPQDIFDSDAEVPEGSANYGWVVNNEEWIGPCCTNDSALGLRDELGNLYRDGHGDQEEKVFAVQLQPDTNYDVMGHFWNPSHTITGMRISNAYIPDQTVTFDVHSNTPTSNEENTRTFTATSDIDGILRIKISPGSTSDTHDPSRWQLSGLEIRGAPPISSN